ncbi:hypothetical protein GGI21_002096 [Coemansia aciculifera]|nr:hypothetical protein GGI21_002096 [Coemansia aciculifera]
MHYRADVPTGSDDGIYGETTTADSTTDASYVRLPGSRQRGNVGNIKEAAAKAKVEASAEAREAVLSEVRAEASAEAALQASAELHLSPLSIVHDEAAILDREASATQELQQFTRDLAHTSYPDEVVITKAAEADSFYTPGTEKETASETDRSAAWDAPRAGGRSAYTEETPYYHAYETPAYGEYRDKYSREQLPYTDLAKDSSMGSDWKIHYNGPSPTMYATGEEPSYTTYYNSNSEPHSYYADNYKLHYSDEHSEGERGYDSSSSKPYNFANMRADSAYARDAAAATSISAESSATASDAPHAVNDLDPLSYGTQACSFRNTLPLDEQHNYGPYSARPSIVVLGVPQPTMMPVAVSAAPATATSTLMLTKYVTPALKVVYGSSE